MLARAEVAQGQTNEDRPVRDELITFVHLHLAKAHAATGAPGHHLCAFIDQATIVANRAQEYWDHKIKGDFEAAYQYEDPDFRKNVRLGDYLRSIGSGAKWLEAKVGNVAIDGEAAKVEMKIRYAIILGPYFPKEGIERDISSYWRLVDGIWYHVFGGKRRGANKKEM